jgi:hypothetical protein
MINHTVRTRLFLLWLLHSANSCPDYTGNKVLLGLCSANIAIFVLAKLYYVKRNQAKERSWNKLSDSEKSTYMETTTDTGSRRLNVRFVH